MIYTKDTQKAMNIAYIAHKDQLDKCGMPYIFHPIHLAEQMEDELSCIVALLHDVVEDSNITIEELSKDFSAEVLLPLALLTHEEGMDYFDYITALSRNPIAVKVKLADLRHNSDPSRMGLAKLSSDKGKKYQKAIGILEQIQGFGN